MDPAYRRKLGVLSCTRVSFIVREGDARSPEPARDMEGECSKSTKLGHLELSSAMFHITVMLSSEQCRAARALLNWTQEDLAVRAGVSRSTVCGFERGEHELQRASAAMIRMTLEQAGVILIETDEQGAGAWLQSPHRPDQPDAR